ncbi:MAG: leucine-rich repeat protein [Clostridia bacterium]|nr:leucine-rich repeat protein [Clostridia bacterium]
MDSSVNRTVDTLWEDVRKFQLELKSMETSLPEELFNEYSKELNELENELRGLPDGTSPFFIQDFLGRLVSFELKLKGPSNRNLNEITKTANRTKFEEGLAGIEERLNNGDSDAEALLSLAEERWYKIKDSYDNAESSKILEKIAELHLKVFIKKVQVNREVDVLNLPKIKTHEECLAIINMLTNKSVDAVSQMQIDNFLDEIMIRTENGIEVNRDRLKELLVTEKFWEVLSDTKGIRIKGETIKKEEPVKNDEVVPQDNNDEKLKYIAKKYKVKYKKLKEAEDETVLIIKNERGRFIITTELTSDNVRNAVVAMSHGVIQEVPEEERKIIETTEYDRKVERISKKYGIPVSKLDPGKYRATFIYTDAYDVYRTFKLNKNFKMGYYNGEFVGPSDIVAVIMNRDLLVVKEHELEGLYRLHTSDLVLPENVQKIGFAAFGGLTFMWADGETLEIPENTDVDEYAFGMNNTRHVKIKRIKVEEREGIKISEYDRKLQMMSEELDLPLVSLNPGKYRKIVVTFGGGALRLNNVSNEVASNKIIAVIMNRNESTIFENEFEDTTWLKLDKLVLPENLQHIGRRAFHNSNIKGTLELPDYVVVSDDAFDSDITIKRISTKKEETKHEEMDIYKKQVMELAQKYDIDVANLYPGDYRMTVICRSVSEPPYPLHVNKIGKDEHGIENIIAVIFNRDLTETKTDECSYLPALTDVVFGDKLKVIDYNSFFRTGLKGEIVLPESVHVVGGGAFDSCDKLEKVIVPNKDCKVYYNNPKIVIQKEGRRCRDLNNSSPNDGNIGEH